MTDAAVSRARWRPLGDVLGAARALPRPTEPIAAPSGGGSAAEAERGAHSVASASRLVPLALAAILALSGALELLRLNGEGYGNTYYAAAVKSMLTSWHAFFFASFDPGGFVAVDKPPLGLWVQAASAALFGFSGVSLLLPQAIAGVLSVALLYLLVRRAFGPAAGLLAALTLALTPISVVTSRNNTMDSQLVLVLMLAAWAASVAAERGRLRWLLGCAALVGLGFNVKMLQAYPVLPGFWLAYLLWAPLRGRTRLAHLALATVVLLAVSLSWSAIVDLTPPDQRPYVGSSGTNSALSLALGYNGLGRVTQALAARIPFLRLAGLTVDLTVAPAFAPQIGSPSLLRLVSPVVAGQASWLMPLALLGLLAAGWQAIRGDAAPGTRTEGVPAVERLARQRVALVVWGGWLLAWAAYFSFARFYHLYYLVMLGPAVAALAGIGLLALWRAYRRGGPGAWLLPSGLLITAALQLIVVSASASWRGWLTPVILLPCLAAAVALAARYGAAQARPAALALAVGIAALLVAPAVWSWTSVRDGNGGDWLPQAGPSFGFGPGAGPFGGGPGGGQPRFGGGQAAQRGGGPGAFGGRGGGGMAFTFAGAQWNSLDPGLVRYLEANQGTARYLVATPTSSYASLFMLATDQPALALGGYQGWDRILTPAQLARLVDAGAVRFFLVSAGSVGGRAADAADATADLAAWVRSSCSAVPAQRWQTSSGGAAARSALGRGGGLQTQQLYDCGQPGSSSS